MPGPPGGVRVTSSSVFKADLIGTPWALRMGVEDMVSSASVELKLARLLGIHFSILRPNTWQRRIPR